MPKVKVPKNSPSIDLTPMVDLGFLLVTFFMLTTVMRPEEPVTVMTPGSVSDLTLPDRELMTITIDKDNRVFYTFDGQQYRKAVLAKMGEKYNTKFTTDEAHTFALLTSFGLPMSKLKEWLALSQEDRKAIKLTGVPIDSLHNELSDWVLFTRLTTLQDKKEFRVAIKADQMTDYTTVKKVIETLQGKKVNRFNLVTNLKTQ
jgi:biopolymer transport protein ExbD